MKKYSLALCSALLLLLNCNSFAAQRFNPVKLNKVQFVSPYIGFIAGDDGAILKTINGGITWDFQSSGTDESLTGLCFNDEKTGTAVSDYGTVIRTTDGGNSWSAQFTGEPLNSVNFIDADNGMTGGELSSDFSGVMYRTADGGNTWQDVNFDGGVVQFLHYQDANNVIAIVLAGSCEFCRSTDGGIDWKLASKLPRSMLECVFTDADNGIAVGYAGWMLRTTDGGTSWTELPRRIYYTLFSVYFSDPQNGTAVGESGVILRTADGGKTWVPQTSNTSADLYGVYFTDANKGIAVGDSGVIIRTGNGGETWTEVP